MKTLAGWQHDKVRRRRVRGQAGSQGPSGPAGGHVSGRAAGGGQVSRKRFWEKMNPQRPGWSQGREQPNDVCRTAAEPCGAWRAPGRVQRHGQGHRMGSVCSESPSVNVSSCAGSRCYRTTLAEG